MKKIRRTRIRTEKRRLVFIQEPAGQPREAFSGHEFCPTCGQPLPAPIRDIAALPPVCAEIHDDDGAGESVIELKKQED